MSRHAARADARARGVEHRGRADHQAARLAVSMAQNSVASTASAWSGQRHTFHLRVDQEVGRPPTIIDAAIALAEHLVVAGQGRPSRSNLPRRSRSTSPPGRDSAGAIPPGRRASSGPVSPRAGSPARCRPGRAASSRHRTNAPSIPRAVRSARCPRPRPDAGLGPPPEGAARVRPASLAASTVPARSTSSAGTGRPWAFRRPASGDSAGAGRWGMRGTKVEAMYASAVTGAVTLPSDRLTTRKRYKSQ